MAITWKKIIAPLALAFVLVGCESSQDIARKPVVVRQMVENSLSICQRPAGDATYAARLGAALDVTRTKDLETLQSRNVTVCLDQRLDSQKTGFWDTRAQGILYNNPNGSGVATVWDNGQTRDEAGWFGHTAADYSGYVLNSFAANARDGRIQQSDPRWYAYDTTTSDGDGNTYQSSSAKAERDFDKDTIAKNPALKTPPVTAPAPAPAPRAGT